MIRQVRIPALLALCGALLSACDGTAEMPRSEQTVSGIAIYLGIVPAEIVQGHAVAPGEPKALHGGTPAGRDSHHVMVALFDAKTGTRITDARVRAGFGRRVREHDPPQDLEPMEINGKMSYGGFFLLRETRGLKVYLEIRRDATSRPVTASFAYDHPT